MQLVMDVPTYDVIYIYIYISTFTRCLSKIMNPAQLYFESNLVLVYELF